MKLYIWNKNVFRDYTSGIAFALATTEEEARQLIYKKAGIDDKYSDYGMSKPADEVREVDQTFSFYMWGGG